MDTILSAYVGSAAVNSLKAQKHELQPEPGQRQHEDHVGEGEAEPAGKVDHATVVWEESVYSREEIRNKLFTSLFGFVV